MKDIIMNKKKEILIGLGILILVVIVGVLAFNAGSKSNEKRLNDKLENLGRDFYENFYYKQVGTTDTERKEFLERYSSIGIKVSLDSLSRFKVEETEKIISEFVTKKGNPCDATESKVVIYPKDPFKNTSYTINVILKCEDVEEKETPAPTEKTDKNSKTETKTEVKKEENKVEKTK